MKRLGNTSSKSGFTLVEVLVTMAIFAIIGIAASSVVNSMMRTSEQSESAIQDLQQLQYSMLTLERDIRSMVPRKNATGRFFFADDERFAFVRNGWLNPGAMLPRSELEPVAYLLEEGNLVRENFYYVDVSASEDAKSRIIFEGVESMELMFYRRPPADEARNNAGAGAAGSNEWLEEWNFTNELPLAIELTLVTERWGRIQRVFTINGGDFTEQVPEPIEQNPDETNPQPDAPDNPNGGAS